MSLRQLRRMWFRGDRFKPECVLEKKYKCGCSNGEYNTQYNNRNLSHENLRSLRCVCVCVCVSVCVNRGCVVLCLPVVVVYSGLTHGEPRAFFKVVSSPLIRFGLAVDKHTSRIRHTNAHIWKKKKKYKTHNTQIPSSQSNGRKASSCGQ